MVTDILFVLALILLNGAFAMSEIAVVSAKRASLERMADEGSAGARRVLALLAEPTRFLSSVQVGITTIGVLSGAIGEATIARHVRAGLERLPALDAYAQPLSLAVTVLAITYVSLILGELVPKRLALTNPERIASLVAPPMRVIARIARPIVWVLTVSTEGVLRLVGVPRVSQARVTMEEIEALIEQGTEAGVLEPGEHEMMTNVLNLDERRVAGVLTPRSDIVYLDLQHPADDNREKLRRESHDVLPLCDGGLRHVAGFVRTRRVLEEVLAGGSIDLRALAEPALYVPESMTLLTLLEHFKRAKLPTALVIDEFGGVEGIVSLTDVLAAIVGDLPGEIGEELSIVRRDDGSWLLDGALGLDRVSRTLGDDALIGAGDAGQYHTLGGLAMLAVGRVPRTGDVFERGRHRFEVVDMDGNRVDRVLASARQDF